LCGRSPWWGLGGNPLGGERGGGREHGRGKNRQKTPPGGGAHPVIRKTGIAKNGLRKEVTRGGKSGGDEKSSSTQGTKGKIGQTGGWLLRETKGHLELKWSHTKKAWGWVLNRARKKKGMGKSNYALHELVGKVQGELVRGNRLTIRKARAVRNARGRGQNRNRRGKPHGKPDRKHAGLTWWGA